MYIYVCVLGGACIYLNCLRIQSLAVQPVTVLSILLYATVAVAFVHSIKVNNCDQRLEYKIIFTKP